MKPDSQTHASRRRFLAGATTAIALRGMAPLLLRADIAAPDARMASFDREVESFMTARSIPGGALAVVKNRRLVYARGYGWGDKEKREPATATSLFRIASISKPFTAVAVLKLIEQGKCKLDDRIFNFIRLKPHLPEGRRPDDRLSQVTVRQCLQHTGGWDRDSSFDPMFRPVEFARSLGKPSPASAEDVIRNMMGLPLDFDPGTRYAYSNFGYCLLGRLIETLAAQGYEKFVQQTVMKPAGITRMRIGATLESGRAPGEVHYYTPGEKLADSVFANHPGKVSWPYGGFNLEAMDSHGAWIASAVDLARFAVALDDPAHSPLLKPDSLREMAAPPPPPVSRNANGSVTDAYYGLGWQVRPIKGRERKANFWHTGSLPGTRTLLVRRWDGLIWAILFNQRQDIPNLPDMAIDGALHKAADAVREWPKEDLFERFP